MGSRSSYVIKRDGEVRSYGAHWKGSSITDDLFWGPKYATKAFEVQAELDELDDIWGGDEGFALIDWDQKCLIWGAQNCELPVHRRVYLRLLAEMWPGWKIQYATRGIEDLLGHLGISDTPRTDDGFDDEDDEFVDDDEPEDDFDDEMFFAPESISSPVNDVDELNPGCWLTIRDADGAYHDYFGFTYELDELLGSGSSLPERLADVPSLKSLPSELVTLSGAVVDQKEKVVWRWEGIRFPEDEESLQKAWEGWAFKDLPDHWHGHMKTTGRSAPQLAGGDRHLLGMTVGALLYVGSLDPEAALANLLTVGKASRAGCLLTTAAVGILGGAFSYWQQSLVAGVLIAILFAGCLALTIVWFRRSAAMMSVVGTMTSFHRDAPHPEVLAFEERRDILDGVLSRLDLPSIAVLEEAGELSRDDFDDDDDDDFDDEDDD